LEKEHSVFVYARAGETRKGDPIWDDDRVTWAPAHYVPTGIWSRHFREWIRSKNLEMVIFNEQRQWKPVVVAKEQGVIVGAYVDYYTQVTVPAFAIYDFLLCNTQRHYSVFSWHPNCYYIPWGVDVEKFKPLFSEIARPTTFLISAGWEGLSDGDRRGTLLALKALREIKNDCRVLVYSQVRFDDMRPEWKRLLLGDDRIELRVGTYDPFPFAEGDVYLYPSRLDGIGLTLPEAISSGLACIATDSGPMNEFVVSHFNGFLIAVDKHLGRPDGYYWAESICSLESIVAAMQGYIDNGKLLKEHKNNARKYALEKLDWLKNSSQLLSRLSEQKPKEMSLEQTRMANDIDRLCSPNFQQRIKGVIVCFSTSIKAVVKC
jgi:glycosyltransferase involved in cell wall biosynthesis